MQQEAMLALPLGSLEIVTSNSKQTLLSPIFVNCAMQLLERVHYALNYICCFVLLLRCEN